MDITIKAASSGNSPFDSIRRIENGIEFWLARELMVVLGYTKWENFGAKEHGMVHKSGNRVTSTVCRALISCNISGLDSSIHFTHSPSVGTRQNSTSEDWKLSRHACYLIGMCGDVNKPEIAAAQSYFAIKTREAEIAITPKAKTLDELSYHDLRCLLAHSNPVFKQPFDVDLSILAGIDPIFWVTPRYCLEYLFAKLENKTDSRLANHDLSNIVWEITSDDSKSSDWNSDVLKAKNELADRLQRQESILNSKVHKRAYQKFKAQLAEFQAQGQLA